MKDGDLVPLKCSSDVLAALATGLSRFGPAEGAPDWLISGAWLCTKQSDYLATSFTNVLADGYVARTLNIHTAAELARAVEADLPDIEGRLRGRGCNVSLAGACDFEAPGSLQHWEAASYSTTVLVRVAERLLSTHRVPCALLFEADDGRLLLAGTDTSTVAMVISDDRELIDRYRSGCEEIAASAFSGFA